LGPLALCPTLADSLPLTLQEILFLAGRRFTGICR
jgi:hypothetical protein